MDEAKPPSPLFKESADENHRPTFLRRLERSIRKRIKGDKKAIEREKTARQQEAQATEILLRYKPLKPTVLIVTHDGTLTGAPVLTYNLALHLLKRFEVIVLFLGPGPILEACRQIGATVLGPITVDDELTERFTQVLLQHVQPQFALINSVEARKMGAALWRAGVPTVSLVHEFAANTRPIGAFYDVVLQSDATIFSTALTRDNALEYHPGLSQTDLYILPQGQCLVPQIKDTALSDHALSNDSAAVLKALRPAGFPAEGMIVVGIGTVHIRKGTDLFLDCATRFRHMNPSMPVRFVWVGKGWDPLYSIYLADQMQRAELGEFVQIIDEMIDLEQVYAAAHVLLLTSRLDPLPNVAIDVLMKGIPMICFDRTTGIAEHLKAHGLAEPCVARYLDTTDMAEKLTVLARSETVRTKIGKMSSAMASELFSMPRYVEKIVTLAEEKILVRKEMEQDAKLILSSHLLRPEFVGGSHLKAVSPATARSYVFSWRKNLRWRKPFPGFHPGIYREQRGLKHGGPDPLADYLRSGQPKGPWQLPVITPSTQTQGKSPRKVALHLHAYYLDLLPAILHHLKGNHTPLDLFVSVTSEENRQRALALLQPRFSGRLEVRVLPNRGRDWGAFLTGFGDILRGDYELIGHVHTKKSIYIGSQPAEQWMFFLLENLLGGTAPMADIILQTMAQDERIGLVFPDDPNAVSWDANRTYAEALAVRLGLPALPAEINFPVGSMFWCRASAIKALVDLNLTWQDYPSEPVPYDGTMLHAIERLLPSVVRASGQDVAVTHVPGITR